LVEVAQDEVAAKVLCLGLPPPTARILDSVPGVDAQIKSYDTVIRRVCEETGALYLDVAALVSREGEDTTLPDGIHFSEAGHIAIAREIANLLKRAEHPVVTSGILSWKATEMPSRVRALGGIAAIPLTLLAFTWLAGVKSWRALLRVKRP
jgi:hypothetical protein